MRVIGMISGTSFDAVEALLVELELDGEVLVCDLSEHRSVPYPSAIREAISALPPAASTIEQVCHLDVEIGQFFATVAKGLVDSHGPVDVVCSHGQTVYHWVEGDVARGTLQLGEPAWIAEANRRRCGQRCPQPGHRVRRPRCSPCEPPGRAIAGLPAVCHFGVPQPREGSPTSPLSGRTAPDRLRYRTGQRLDGRVRTCPDRRRGDL